MSDGARNSPAALAALAVLALVGLSCANSTGSDSDQAADRGAQVYATSCASCHGADLRGTDQGPSQLSIVYEPDHHPDASYVSAITNGATQHHWRFGDMPPVEGLSSDDVAAVIDFIRSEQERLGFEPYPPE